ncbi:hypothetical protein F7Q96_01235 [Cupriavidus gilardii]|nr:hypothetical protein F7Q96_01235 [Cupriavidus gilardii]
MVAAPNHSGCDSPHAAAVVPADPVTGFLLSRGLQTDIAYLGESAFELGRRVRFAGLDLIYRFEQGTLLICDIAAYEESGVSPPNSPGSPYSPDSPARPRAPGDVGGAMRTLVSLIHAIERSVPEVETVEGRVPLMGGKVAKAANAVDEGDGGEIDEQQLGRRLLSLYRKLGAQCGPDDDAGMVRVRYRMRGGTRQGRPAPP